MYLLPVLAVKETAGHVYKDDFISKVTLVTGQKPTMIYAMTTFSFDAVLLVGLDKLGISSLAFWSRLSATLKGTLSDTVL